MPATRGLLQRRGALLDHAGEGDRTVSTLGFALAVELRPGDFVQYAGMPMQILSVQKHGRDWPYYELDGRPGELISWQRCGAVYKTTDHERTER